MDPVSPFLLVFLLRGGPLNQRAQWINTGSGICGNPAGGVLHYLLQQTLDLLQHLGITWSPLLECLRNESEGNLGVSFIVYDPLQDMTAASYVTVLCEHHLPEAGVLQLNQLSLCKGGFSKGSAPYLAYSLQ